MLILGIDPGKDGACVLINENQEILYKFVIPKLGNTVDLQVFNNHLKYIKNTYDSNNIHVCIELVHSIFGASSKSTFQFGYVCGIIEGLVSAYNFSYTMIQPKEWQKVMFLGIPEQRKPSTVDKNGKIRKGRLNTKVMAEMAFKRLYPNTQLKMSERSKKNHDGLIDALLIAMYGLKKIV